MIKDETFKNYVRKDYPIISSAERIEEILCLATLIAKLQISACSTLEDSQNYYDNLAEGCNSCPCKNICLACIINE